MDILNDCHGNANTNTSMPYTSMDLFTLKFLYFPAFTTVLIRFKLATMPDAISYFLLQERNKKATEILPRDIRDIAKRRDVSSINLVFGAFKKFEYSCKYGPVIVISPGSSEQAIWQ